MQRGKSQGKSDIPGKQRSVLSKAKRKGVPVEFDPEDFSKWVTGAHKRKVERQKVGHKEAADKIKQEKSSDRQEQNQRVRAIVKQHFGDVTVDDDGRLLISGTSGLRSGQTVGNFDEQSESDSEDEYLREQRADAQKREKKLKFLAQAEKMKKLPKWAQDKVKKEVEMTKDDSIIKEQNESFLRAQYSFNQENKLGEIANNAEKNKLLKNLQQAENTAKLQRERAQHMPTVLNFENADSYVTVETTNLDQTNLASSIISRRTKRDLQQGSTPVIDRSRLSKRQNYTVSKQLHTLASDDDSDFSDDSEEEEEEDKQLSRQVKQLTKSAQKPTHVQNISNTNEIATDPLSEQERILAKFGRKTQKEQKEQKIQKAQKGKKGKKEQTVLEEVAPIRRVNQQAQQIVQSDDNEMGDSEEEEEEGEQWEILDETIVDAASDEEEGIDEDDTMKKMDQLQKKRVQEYKEQEQQLRREEKQSQFERLQKEREDKKLKAATGRVDITATNPNKRQKRNTVIDNELSRDKELASIISSDIVATEFSLATAQPISMANASAWFMLPKPQIWIEEEERKQRLFSEQLRLQKIKEGEWDFAAEKEKKRKLTTLEALELDPTYGWDEGEANNTKDRGEIFGIPAASMNGRYRHKPLSDKNKKRSSDARKAKKQDRQKVKDQEAAMAFEAGFADTNTTGSNPSKIKWDDSSDDDKNNSKVYQGGAKFKEEGKKKNKKQSEFKNKRRIENQHKRGKMVSGKYYFGEKNSAVNF